MRLRGLLLRRRLLLLLLRRRRAKVGRRGGWLLRLRRLRVVALQGRRDARCPPSVARRVVPPTPVQPVHRAVDAIHGGVQLHRRRRVHAHVRALLPGRRRLRRLADGLGARLHGCPACLRRTRRRQRREARRQRARAGGPTGQHRGVKRHASRGRFSAGEQPSGGAEAVVADCALLRPRAVHAPRLGQVCGAVVGDHRQQVLLRGLQLARLERHARLHPRARRDPDSLCRRVHAQARRTRSGTRARGCLAKPAFARADEPGSLRRAVKSQLSRGKSA